MELRKNKIKNIVSCFLIASIWIVYMYIYRSDYQKLIVLSIGVVEAIVFSYLSIISFKEFNVRFCTFNFSKSLIFYLRWGATYSESLDISNEKIKSVNAKITPEDTFLSLDLKKLKFGYLKPIIMSVINGANEGKKYFIKSLSIDYLLKKELSKHKSIIRQLDYLFNSYIQINLINAFLFFMCVLNDSFEKIISSIFVYIWIVILIGIVALIYILNNVRKEI